VPVLTDSETESWRILLKALQRLQGGFTDLPALSSSQPNGPELERVLLETADRLRDNYPYFHPL